ncbi:hypothetical protein EJD04_25910 [Salmonella enterica]|nr:hypothetical protein [Salmonella enterica]
MSLSDNTQIQTSSDYLYRLVIRRRLMLIIIMLAIAVSLVLDSVLGSSALSLNKFWQTLIHPANVSAGIQVIVWEIRLPSALMALLVGMVLGLAGAVNPLHHPAPSKPRH